MRNRRLTAAAMLAAAGIVLSVTAYGGDGARSRVPLLAAYTQECADCHVAYPPGLLPAASWLRLMSNLSRHFGTDASLPEPTVVTLNTWLTANAARSGRRAQEPPDDCINHASWFAREHREVPKDAWSRPAVKTAANCAACHTHANEGVFDEHDVRIPKGSVPGVA